MLLVIDIGNTNTVIGLYDDEELLSDWRLATDRYRTADEWGQLLRSLLHLEDRSTALIKAIAISSVVPPLDSILERSCLRYFDVRPFFVDHNSDAGIQINYETPADVGADRIVSAVGAISRHGSPAIVIDFGTATTFDVISSRQEYVGGVICPGISISATALFEKAAKLPRVDLKRPESVIGTNTVASMQSGLYFGYLQQIRGIIDLIKRELPEEPIVVITGGLAPVFEVDLGPDVVCDQLLMLEGLRLIFERNN